MQPAVTKLARPAAAAGTSALWLQTRASPATTAAFICSGCLQSPPRSSRRRAGLPSPTIITPKSHYTTAASPSSPSPPTAPTAPVSSGIARLPSRRLILVSGPDAAKYLQGVITANILDPMTGGPRTSGFYAAFLTAKGRVLHDVFIYPYHQSAANNHHDQPGESFLIEVDAAEAPRLQQHIRRYKLRAKFDVRLLDESELAVWHAWEEDNDSTSLSQLSSSSPSLPKEILTLGPDPRNIPTLGYRLIAAPTSSSSNQQQHPLSSLTALPAVPEPQYTLHRYLLGVAEGQGEILRDQALPLESNMDVVGPGIDFRKGCYVGQELTIRTKHRGVVRKRILPVIVYQKGEKATPGGQMERGYRPTIGKKGEGEEQEDDVLRLPDPEARIGRADKPDRRVGQWLAGVGNVGLALCRLEVMTDLQVAGETASAGYNPDQDEFVVSSGTGGGNGGAGEEGEGGGEGGAVRETKKLKVKAFVPGWLRAELMNPAH